MICHSVSGFWLLYILETIIVVGRFFSLVGSCSGVQQTPEESTGSQDQIELTSVLIKREVAIYSYNLNDK